MKCKSVILVDGAQSLAQQYARKRAAGLVPRQDFMEIAQKVGAHVHTSDERYLFVRHVLRPLEQRLRINIAVPLITVRRRGAYQIILSTSEKVALPMAALLSLTKDSSHIEHVVIAHKLSSVPKRTLFRLWALQHTFSQVICVARPQAAFARERLKVASQNVHFTHDKVDQQFFRPQGVRESNYILAVGREQRDYETLLRALQGTDIQLIIVASSPWSSSSLQLPRCYNSPVKVIGRVSYTELRELYAGARLVVAPLNNVDYAAGVNALLEAMSMGKAVVATNTQGLAGYLNDGETGLHVEAGDVEALRAAMMGLWGRPEERVRLGANARQAVLDGMNLDSYLEKIIEILYTDRSSF